MNMKLYLSLLFAVGSAAWVFNKMIIRTHRNQSGVITAIITAVIAFIVFYTLFSTFNLK